MNIDKLVAKHTPCADLDDLTHPRVSFVPRLQCGYVNPERIEQRLVADRFDRIMMARGDSRRAVRI